MKAIFLSAATAQTSRSTLLRLAKWKSKWRVTLTLSPVWLLMRLFFSLARMTARSDSGTCTRKNPLVALVIMAIKLSSHLCWSKRVVCCSPVLKTKKSKSGTLLRTFVCTRSRRPKSHCAWSTSVRKTSCYWARRAATSWPMTSLSTSTLIRTTGPTSSWWSRRSKMNR